MKARVGSMPIKMTANRMQKRRETMKKTKWKKRDLAAPGLFLAALLLQLLARRSPAFAQAYRTSVYRILAETLGRLMSLLPFSVAEIGLYLLLLAAAGGLAWFVWRLFCRRNKWRQTFFQAARAVLLAVAALFFAYTVGCGINYHSRAFSETAGFVTKPSSREELAGLCRILAEEINAAAARVETDGDGCLLLQDGYKETARRAMESLGEVYPCLAGFYPQPKGLLVSRILSVQKIEGIYSPFTLEANYNREMPNVNIPVTMCHELSHLRGFMREDEANFIAYLACRESNDPQFVYSGAVLAFIHSGNALYADGGQEEYWEIYDSLCETARRDLSRDSAFWRQFDGKVAEVSSQMNDAYLKVNRQEDGVKSYGRMVDLLLAMYRQEGLWE